MTEPKPPLARWLERISAEPEKGYTRGLRDAGPAALGRAETAEAQLTEARAKLAETFEAAARRAE